MKSVVAQSAGSEAQSLRDIINNKEIYALQKLVTRLLDKNKDNVYLNYNILYF